MVVPKKDGKARVCVDFTDLHKACPKDSFTLPRISQLVDLTAGHERISFLDAYTGYNQIKLNPAREEHTSFITLWGLQYYTIMPFRLKSVGATFQWLVSILFKELLRKTMEAYVDDLLVKS